MDIEKLKELIYTQLFAAEVYDQLASISPDQKTQDTMLAFKTDSLNNAAYLNSFYQMEMTSSYVPIITTPVPQESFKDTVLWMMRYEAGIYRTFFRESFQKELPVDYITLLQYIAGTSNHHSLILTHTYLT